MDEVCNVALSVASTKNTIPSATGKYSRHTRRAENDKYQKL